MYLSLCWYLCLRYWMMATCSQIVASQRERGSIGSLVEKVFCSEEMFSCQESKNTLSPILDYLISFKLLVCFFRLSKFGNNSYKKNGTFLCSQKCWKDLGVSSHYFRSTFHWGTLLFVSANFRENATEKLWSSVTFIHLIQAFLFYFSAQ